MPPSQPAATAAGMRLQGRSSPPHPLQLSPRRESTRNCEQKAAAAEARLQPAEHQKQEPTAAEARLQLQKRTTQQQAQPGNILVHDRSAAAAPPAARQPARPAPTVRIAGPAKASSAAPKCHDTVKPGEQAVLDAIARAESLSDLPSRPSTERLRVVYYQKKAQLAQQAQAAAPAAGSAKPAGDRRKAAATTLPAVVAPPDVRDSAAGPAAPQPAVASRPRHRVRDPVVAELADVASVLADGRRAVAKRLRSADNSTCKPASTQPANAQLGPLHLGATTAAGPSALPAAAAPSALPATAATSTPASRRSAQAQSAAPVEAKVVAAPAAKAKRAAAATDSASLQRRPDRAKASALQGQAMSAGQPSQPAAQVMTVPPQMVRG